MAYKTEELLKQALEVAESKKLIFIEDIVAYLPCSKPTFYEHKINESNQLKEILLKNCTDIKTNLRAKWYKSDNATLQMALMKLVCTNEERRKLAMNYTEIAGKDGEGIGLKILVESEEQKKILDNLWDFHRCFMNTRNPTVG